MPSGIDNIEAFVFIGKREYSFGSALKRLTHIRGWDVPASYCLIDISTPQIEAMTEVMNYGKVTVRYGRDQRYFGPVDMEIVAVDNQVEFSSLQSRITVAEPGFLRLIESTKIKSYPNKTISQIAAEIANPVSLRTTGIKETSGAYTFVQPNITDMKFLSEYLLPIATDSSRSAPYLLTIDSQTLHLRPPSLNQEPIIEAVLDTSKDTVVKRFTVKNQGILTDLSTGGEFEALGYDFRRKGRLFHTEKISNRGLTNKTPYKTKVTRKHFLPYDEQWMIDAYTRNRMAKGQFIVGADVLMVGDARFSFDQMIKFSSVGYQDTLQEYSGLYYIYSVANTLEPRFFTSQLDIRSNAFLRAETPQKRSGAPRIRGQSGGLPAR